MLRRKEELEIENPELEKAVNEQAKTIASYLNRLESLMAQGVQLSDEDMTTYTRVKNDLSIIDQE
jgi:hypothetical protein